MTEQEKINTELQTKLALQDAKFSAFVDEMRDFKDEMRDFKSEIRDRDNQRVEDIREIRNSLQNLQLSGRNLNIVTLLGIAAIVIAVLLK